MSASSRIASRIVSRVRDARRERRALAAGALLAACAALLGCP